MYLRDRPHDIVAEVEHTNHDPPRKYTSPNITYPTQPMSAAKAIYTTFASSPHIEKYIEKLKPQTLSTTNTHLAGVPAAPSTEQQNHCPSSFITIAPTIPAAPVISPHITAKVTHSAATNNTNDLRHDLSTSPPFASFASSPLIAPPPEPPRGPSNAFIVASIDALQWLLSATKPTKPPKPKYVYIHIHTHSKRRQWRQCRHGLTAPTSRRSRPSRLIRAQLTRRSRHRARFIHSRPHNQLPSLTGECR